MLQKVLAVGTDSSRGSFSAARTLLQQLPGKVTVETTVQSKRIPEKPLVLMRFKPAWAYIDGIREFGRFFCQTTFDTADVAERACVVIQETLENAIKYSTDGPNGELELEIRAQGDQIEFSVSSLPDPAHMEYLREELRGLHALEPEQAYLAAFSRAASEPDASARLGLARVRYEGHVELTLREEGNGRIRVTALGKL